MKSKHKRIYMAGLLIFFVLVLSGCVSYDASGQPSGWVYEYLGRPTSYLLDWIAGIFGNSHGIAIIIITIITRLLMLPSSINMTKNSTISQAKMKIAQPEINAVQEDLQNTDDPQEKAILNNELMAIYKKYDISMTGGLAGCLPMLIQLPIISAVYAAIRSSETIAQSTFLGINLGERSIIIVVAVVLVYGLQGWLMQKNMPQSDNSQAQQTSKTMMLMNPIMLGYISWISAAGLGLYFLTGGVFAIGQQLYTSKVVRPRIDAMMEKEAEKYKNSEPIRKPRETIVQTTGDDAKKRIVPIKQNVNNGKRRNEGVQQRNRNRNN